MDKFSTRVGESLKHYVYRLIDPRNGQTFYVGRGTGDRVFHHAKDELKLHDNRDELSEKLETIRKIKRAGLEVIHVVHRHGLDEDMAKEVEATLIDAIAGLANLAPGFGSNERGPAHVKELEDRYSLNVMGFNPKHKLLVIKARQDTVDQSGSLYDAIRGRWVLKKEKAAEADYVLATVEGVCRGVFVAESWKKCSGTKNRHEFDGREAPDEIAKLYVGKLIPETLRKPGMANPIHYVGY